MTEKKTIGLGKKATEAKTTEKPAAEKIVPKKVVKVEPKAGIGKKAEAVAVKIEVKSVPAIVGFGDREKAKDVPAKAESKSTAKLPAKSTGVASKLAKIQSEMKKVVAKPHVTEEVPTKVAEVVNSNQLDIAATRRPVAAVKKVTTAPGKISFDEVLQNQAAATSAVPAKPPFFDFEKYLKK